MAELTEYIKRGLENNISLQDIVKRLKQSGFSAGVINAALDNISLERKNKELESYITKLTFDELGKNTIDDRIDKELRQKSTSRFAMINMLIIALVLSGFVLIKLADSPMAFAVKDIITDSLKGGADKVGGYIQDISETDSSQCDELSLAIVTLKGKLQLCYFDSEKQNLQVMLFNNGEKEVSSLNILVGGSYNLMKIIENEKISPGKVMARLYDYDFDSYGEIYNVDIVPSLNTGDGLVYCREQGIAIENIGRC